MNEPELVARSFGPFTVARVAMQLPGQRAHVTYSLWVRLTPNLSVQLMFCRFT